MTSSEHCGARRGKCFSCLPLGDKANLSKMTSGETAFSSLSRSHQERTLMEMASGRDSPQAVSPSDMGASSDLEQSDTFAKHTRDFFHCACKQSGPAGRQFCHVTLHETVSATCTGAVPMSALRNGGAKEMTMVTIFFTKKKKN